MTSAVSALGCKAGRQFHMCLNPALSTITILDDSVSSEAPAGHFSKALRLTVRFFPEQVSHCRKAHDFIQLLLLSLSRVSCRRKGHWEVLVAFLL